MIFFLATQTAIENCLLPLNNFSITFPIPVLIAARLIFTFYLADMPRPLAFIIFMLFMLAPASCFGQVAGAESDIFCGKRWYCEMTKDADGTIHPPDPGSDKDFMQFLCDSTFFLTEKGIQLKGRWEFDNIGMVLTLKQTQIDTMPESFSFHIIDYDEGHLVVIGREGTDNEETAHHSTKYPQKRYRVLKTATIDPACSMHTLTRFFPAGLRLMSATRRQTIIS